MMANNEDWKKWGAEIHTTSEQLDRQARAAQKDMTPISIEDDRGAFRGSTKDYVTTLLICSCRDYALRRKPCKHIYRLAHELGVYNLNNTTTDNNISKKKRIEDIMPSILAISEDLQRLYKDICYSCGNDNKKSIGYVLDTTTATTYIDAGLLCVVSENNKIFQHYAMQDLRKLAKTLTTEKLPAKKIDLVSFITTNFPDVVAEFPEDELYVELPYDIAHLAMKIHKRLCDKFPVEHDF